MDQVHESGPWTGSMDQVHGPQGGPWTGSTGVVHGPGSMFCIRPLRRDFAFSLLTVSLYRFVLSCVYRFRKLLSPVVL